MSPASAGSHCRRRGWSGPRPWTSLRDSASVDGASSLRMLRAIFLPLPGRCWSGRRWSSRSSRCPKSPRRCSSARSDPQTLVPMLMTWVHMLRYDAMIEASLLITAIVAFAGVVALMLISGEVVAQDRNQMKNRIRHRDTEAQREAKREALCLSLCLCISVLNHFLVFRRSGLILVSGFGIFCGFGMRLERLNVAGSASRSPTRSSSSGTTRASWRSSSAGSRVR